MIYKNGMPSVGRINFESDFVINITLPEDVGERDFKIDFYTNKQRIVRFSRINGELSTNLKDNGKGGFLAVFRRHGLQPGKLNIRATYITETDLSPDGEMVEVIPEIAQFELVQGAGDIGLDALIELSAPQKYPSPSGGNGGNSVPIYFVPTVDPLGVADTKTIKKTIITLPSTIATFDAENIKMITPNGVVFLGYDGGTYEISEDKLSVVVDWNFDAVEGEYELRIPKCAIVLENGAENESVVNAYNVTVAPIVYFTPEVSPVAGDVSSDVVKKMTLTFPSEIDTFDGATVRLIKSFGNVWYDYAAKGTISEDKLSMSIEWDFAPEVGLTYTLELPEGCITLNNGDKNAATQVEYVITN